MRHASTALLLVTLVACGDDSTSGSSGAGGGTTGSSSTASGPGSGGGATVGAGGGTSSSTGGDGGGGSTSVGSGGSTPFVPLRGYFFLLNGFDAEDAPIGVFGGDFTETTAEGPSPCTTTTSGPCTATRCEGVSESTSVRVDGGTISVAGTTTPLEVPFDADTQYYEQRIGDFLWDAGAEVTLSAAGAGDVPAFELAAVGPSHATLTAPAFDGSAVIDRTQDLEVAWDADGDHGQLYLQVGSYTEDLFTSIICLFPMADRQGVVPSELLLLAAPDADGSVGAIDVGNGEEDVDGWKMFVSLQRNASAIDNPAGASAIAALE